MKSPEPNAEELYREARNNVRRNWSYWRPIVYGKVTIPSAEYDAALPDFIREVNAAMDERAEQERDAYERAKQENEST